MKKFLTTIFVVVTALTLVACKKPKNTQDLDEIKDHLEKVEVNSGKEKNYGKEDTFYNTTSNVTSMSHYDSTGASESNLYELIVGTLFEGDFDWEAAVENGLADRPGDLSKVDNGEVSIHDFGFRRYPSLAETTPYSVTNNTTTSDIDEAKLLLDNKWRIKLRDDITFEDGLKINAYVFSYSWKQLLSPLLNNARAQNLYALNMIPLKNAKSYYLQGKPVSEGSKEKYPAVKWEDVGFKVIDETTFEIELEQPITQWQLMGQLSTPIYSAVHPEVFEASKDRTGTRASYGSIDYKIPSSGPYLIKHWQDNKSYTFVRNESYKGYRANDYDIKALNFVVNANETSIINEFEQGNLDVASVASGAFFDEYKDNPLTKFTPTTSTFRLAFGGGVRPEESSWEYTKVSNAAMSNVEFRKALYLAFDRDNFLEVVSPNVKPSGVFLTDLYQATEEANESYRETEAAKNALKDAGLTETAINNNGFDLQEAQILFNKVYGELKAAGKLIDNKIYLQIALFDAESNRKIGTWAKAQLEGAFGTDKIEIITKYTSSDELNVINDTKDYDLTFSGWQGMNFNPAIILSTVFSSLNTDYMLEGIQTHDLEIKANLKNFKKYVEDKGINATTEEKKILSLLDDEGNWVGILDYDSEADDFAEKKFLAVSHLISLESFVPNYDGKKDDFASITAGIESALLGAYIAAPLFQNIGATIYSERVQFDLPEYHSWLGWGGLLYRSLTK